MKYSDDVLAHGPIAPSDTDSSGSATISSGSTSRRVPSPAQVGHAPYGVLNENIRGAGSSKESPQLMHAKSWEKACGLPPSGSTIATPPARPIAVSSESLSRDRTFERRTILSTITSTVCCL